MKISSSAFMLALLGGALVDGMSIRGNTKHANKLMAYSRRLEGSGDGESGDGASGDGQSGDSGDASGDSGDESYFLKDYSIKLLSCIPQQVFNYENGEAESSTVTFRLCPSDSCNSTTSILGCDEGYGDYVVGIDTFLEAYRESQREEHDEENENGNPMVVYNQWGQEFDASEYMECSEYRQEEGDEQQQQNGNVNYYQDMQFFIGPGCSENGTSIALNTYMDDECTYPFEGNFSMISPGWEILPFSDGGLVSMDCVSCSSVDDEGNMEVSEMCQQEYESSIARCEQSMNTSDYYQYTSTAGCDFVDSILTSVYGNLTTDESTLATTVKTTVSNVSTKFMDTLSTKEARAFIAGMVIFGLSFFIGVSFIACICVKKRRKRQVLRKQSKLLPSGSDEDAPVEKRHSSVVSFVRSSTASIKESVVAAAASITGATKAEDDNTVKSEYNNMEDTADTSPTPDKAEESVTASEATTKTRGSRFLAKMDKHLKKKMPFSKKK